MMLRGAGFVVHDLGVDTKPDEFIDAVTEHGAEILGMSALLTTTMPNMGKTIEAFEEVGLRGHGEDHARRRALTQEFADDMGADAYGGNAIACVTSPRDSLARKRFRSFLSGLPPGERHGAAHRRSSIPGKPRSPGGHFPRYVAHRQRGIDLALPIQERRRPLHRPFRLPQPGPHSSRGRVLFVLSDDNLDYRSAWET